MGKQMDAARYAAAKMVAAAGMTEVAEQVDFWASKLPMAAESIERALAALDDDETDPTIEMMNAARIYRMVGEQLTEIAKEIRGHANSIDCTRPEEIVEKLYPRPEPTPAPQ